MTSRPVEHDSRLENFREITRNPLFLLESIRQQIS